MSQGFPHSNTYKIGPSIVSEKKLRETDTHTVEKSNFSILNLSGDGGIIKTTLLTNDEVTDLPTICNRKM